MRINYVLVDYENVQSVDLTALKREDFRVIVFLGANQRKLPSELAVQMQSLGERGEYVQVSGAGHNALDFHIAFVLGERSTADEQSFFHIISKDLGFDPLITYLKRLKIHAARYKSISDIPLVRSSQPKTAAARAAYFIDKLSGSKMAKPRTQKTLANAVRVVFHRQLSDTEVDQTIAGLCSRGFLSIEGDRVTYTEPSA